MTPPRQPSQVKRQHGAAVAKPSALGIELVVVDHVRHFGAAVRLAAEQEGAGLVPPPAAALKLADDLAPAARVAGDAMLRRQQRPNSRLD
jgi:hypothetical protein